MTEPLEKNKTVDVLPTEYQCAHMTRDHYDNIRWIIGTVFIAASIGSLGVSFLEMFGACLVRQDGTTPCYNSSRDGSCVDSLARCDVQHVFPWHHGHSDETLAIWLVDVIYFDQYWQHCLVDFGKSHCNCKHTWGAM